MGPNRLAFGLLKQHQLVPDAQAIVRVYALKGPQGHLTTVTPAQYAALEGGARGTRVHLHPDGTRHVHSAETDVQGVYVAQVTFAHAGIWGLEIVAQYGEGVVEVARVSVTVLEAPRTPAPGTAAPRSHNRIASDVADLRQIDTSEPPDPRLHQVRIADAIAQGKPQVIVFATPKFCLSRLCGPIVDIVRLLLPAYSDRVVFTHQEIWQDFTARQVFPTVEEWHLQSEPWVFVVDGKGVIRAKFEGLVTVREIELALQQALEVQ